MLKRAIIIALKGSEKRITNPIRQLIKIKIKPSFILIFPEAMGRFLVLETCLSISLSTISFHAQPAARIQNEPNKKIKVYIIKSIKDGFDKAIPHRHG